MTRQKVIDLLAMSRFANLPTVWSNGLLGVLIGWSAFPDQAHLCPICVTLLGISLSFLYLGGCFFNDWHDLDFDTKTRPDRPIPSGRWPRQTILSLSIILMSGGLVLIAFVSPPAGLFAFCIIICILAYTKWHKINPTSFFFMAGARNRRLFPSFLEPVYSIRRPHHRPPDSSRGRPWRIHPRNFPHRSSRNLQGPNQRCP